MLWGVLGLLLCFTYALGVFDYFRFGCCGLIVYFGCFCFRLGFCGVFMCYFVCFGLGLLFVAFGYVCFCLFRLLVAFHLRVIWIVTLIVVWIWYFGFYWLLWLRVLCWDTMLVCFDWCVWLLSWFFLMLDRFDLIFYLVL